MRHDEKTKALIEWFQALYRDRTENPDILDLHPAYRVHWTEILDKMRELGFDGDAVDQRVLWAEIRKSIRLNKNR